MQQSSSFADSSDSLDSLMLSILTAIEPGKSSKRHHRVDECKILLVSLYWCVNVEETMEERLL